MKRTKRRRKPYPFSLFLVGLVQEMLRLSLFIVLGVVLILAGTDIIQFVISGLILLGGVLLFSMARQLLLRGRYLYDEGELTPAQEAVLERWMKKEAARKGTSVTSAGKASVGKTSKENSSRADTRPAKKS